MNKIVKSVLSLLIVFLTCVVSSCGKAQQTTLENFFKSLA